jgi:acetoin utilization deacetylase AcuC-like enzyme
MPTAFITHPDCLLHDMGPGQPEVATRLSVIEQALQQLNCEKYVAPLVTREQLSRVHDVQYIEHIFTASPKEGLICLDPDTWMNPGSLQAALRAAGAVIYAVDLVLKNEAQKVFCNVRPPGHHAEKNAAMGFCIFNNVAVGVAHALEAYHLKRIAIIDFDAHHGNGIENIFARDERVLYCSSFEHPFYPYSGADTVSSHILNIPLAAGTKGEVFRHKVSGQWLQQVRDFKPEIIFFSAGFDAYIEDPLSDLMLCEEDYAWITKEIVKIADEVCHGRIISVLEGGYALDTLGGCVLAHVNAFQR